MKKPEPPSPNVKLRKGDVITIAGETGWEKKPDRRFKCGYRLVRKNGPLVRWVVTSTTLRFGAKPTKPAVCFTR